MLYVYMYHLLFAKRKSRIIYIYIARGSSGVLIVRHIHVPYESTTQYPAVPRVSIEPELTGGKL